MVCDNYAVSLPRGVVDGGLVFFGSFVFKIFVLFCFNVLYVLFVFVLFVPPRS